MHCDYSDITEKLGPPIWYDRLGFPRYCNFHPKETSNIYADVVIFIRIACQACGQKFLVAEPTSVHGLYETKPFRDFIEANKIGKKESIRKYVIPFFKSLSRDELSNFIHYGDPPRHNHCVGDTMNCEDLQIVEFWVNDIGRKNDWSRVKELEIDLPDLTG